MRFVILTGISGAGKSTALKMMEDMGYYCVDNLPILLIERFYELSDNASAELQKVAVGIDVRNGQNLNEMQDVLKRLRAEGRKFEILFLDSDDPVLVKRYKETRRSHPLAQGERVDKGIGREREQLRFLKENADYIIDTSRLLTRELKVELEKIFVNNKEYKNLFVTVLSFGFKYGIPADSDLVFDVRFLPNPYYVEGLRLKNGNDKEIQEFVLQYEEAHVFLDKLEDMIRFLIPNYIAEGKNQLVISIGCTGGKHRSVTLAGELYQRLSHVPENAKKNTVPNYGLKIEHRDILKDTQHR
ncbi:MAG: RNase adapter RapZ [Eubacterium sp.]|nr:RNase adapter RapZ [Eubacterium sp.]